MKQKENVVYLFTDGACQHNPGPGGWGFVLLEPGFKVVEKGGCLKMTTNNQMEIQAILEGVLHLISKDDGKPVEVYTDSKYVVQAVEGWISSWIKNGWKTSAGKDVMNQELWESLDLNLKILKRVRPISFHHVPSHVGIVLNERADKIASLCAEKQKSYFCGSDFSQYPYTKALDNLEEDIRKGRELKKGLSRKKGKAAYSYAVSYTHLTLPTTPYL